MNEAQKIVSNAINEHNYNVRVTDRANAILRQMPEIRARLEGKDVGDFEGLLADDFDDIQVLVDSGEIVIYTAPLLDYESSTLKVFGTQSAIRRHTLFSLLPLITITLIITVAFFTSIWWILLGVLLVPVASFASVPNMPLGRWLPYLAAVSLVVLIQRGDDILPWIIVPAGYLISHYGTASLRKNYRNALLKAARVSEIAFLILIGTGLINVYWFPTNEDCAYRLTLEDTPVRVSPSTRKAMGR